MALLSADVKFCNAARRADRKLAHAEPRQLGVKRLHVFDTRWHAQLVGKTFDEFRRLLAPFGFRRGTPAERRSSLFVTTRGIYNLVGRSTRRAGFFR